MSPYIIEGKYGQWGGGHTWIYLDTCDRLSAARELVHEMFDKEEIEQGIARIVVEIKILWLTVV